MAALETVDDGLLLLDLVGDDPLGRALASGRFCPLVLGHGFVVLYFILRIQLRLLRETEWMNLRTEYRLVREKMSCFAKHQLGAIRQKFLAT